MKTHAALPDVKDLQRVRKVVTGFVKQAVAQPAADDHAHDPQEKYVLDIPARPGRGVADGRERLVAQTQDGQQHEKAEGHEVGQAIPVNGEGAQLEGDGIDFRVDQHGGYCAFCA